MNINTSLPISMYLGSKGVPIELQRISTNCEQTEQRVSEFGLCSIKEICLTHLFLFQISPNGK